MLNGIVVTRHPVLIGLRPMEQALEQQRRSGRSELVSALAFIWRQRLGVEGLNFHGFFFN